MTPPAFGVGDQLAFEIAGVEPGEPRRERAVAFTGEAVAGHASILRAGIGPAQRDEFAGRGEAVGRFHRTRRAARDGQQAEGVSEDEGSRHLPEGTGTRGGRFRWCRPRRQDGGECLPRLDLIVPLALAAAACQPPPASGTSASAASVERGKRAIERVGCAACHTIQGIDWPRGRTAPQLAGVDRRGLIAGRLPARPDVLAAFVRDAPSLVPETVMPAMPLSETEAMDVAAFLLAGGD